MNPMIEAEILSEIVVGERYCIRNLHSTQQRVIIGLWRGETGLSLEAQPIRKLVAIPPKRFFWKPRTPDGKEEHKNGTETKPLYILGFDQAADTTSLHIFNRLHHVRMFFHRTTCLKSTNDVTERIKANILVVIVWLFALGIH
ncbi:hypothetical protein ISN44_As10g020400 [Arabidopsis suecica]|uniref:Uncharacterized protein n=1 Tax=Arabidopsis suecica TaxID=45249 RepID=A0A8T2A0Y9_ARASU|nr:hypothetical protein ISN44_As10g020400 [Arabidopsis suecica]